VTTLGLRGDGAFDNAHVLQQAVNKFAGKATLFFPYGIYLLKDTVYLPTGTKLLGQVAIIENVVCLFVCLQNIFVVLIWFVVVVVVVLVVLVVVSLTNR
jgi:hypothetical protein